jgi:glycosyltransferase involved in cell wall biosynthesis
MSTKPKKRLAILINVVAPYRLPIYEYLNEHFNLQVFCGKREGNRSWVLIPSAGMNIQEAWGWVFPLTSKTGVDGVRDTHYVHINPGLMWKLLRFNPDVIITNEMGFRTAIALLYGDITGTPVWVWWGGTKHSERNVSLLTQFLRRRIVRRVKHWISYGQEATEYLESRGVAKSGILQIQNCVEQERFIRVPETKSGLLDGLQRPILLCVGQLLERKGLSQLIESCARLAAENRKFSLVLVGNGPEKEALAKLTSEKRFNNLHMIPNQDQKRINQLYHEADLFVFPTLEDIWGLVVNEAIWAGLPVVCSCYAGCASELISEECVFDPLVPENIDAVIRRTLRSDTLPVIANKPLRWQEVAERIAFSLAESHQGDMKSNA